MTDFNYDSIPLGYYDEITKKQKGIRSYWHYLKFQRVVDSFSPDNSSILDIGCFSGTFLGMLDKEVFKEQIGIDILKEQVEYANRLYGNDYRKFYHYNNINKIPELHDKTFQCITFIEVIEHLTQPQIAEIFSFIDSKLKPGGQLIITTPNYSSLWPAIEVLLNMVSDVKYEEQHITKFNYFNFERKLKNLVGDLLNNYTISFKTTTHFMSPFLAGFSSTLASTISKKYSHKNWKFPFGSLILIKLSKK